MSPIRRRSLAILLAAGLALGGCQTGRILLMDRAFERRETQALPVRIGVQGVPRARSDKYQGMLEESVVELARASGLFESVSYRSFDPDDVDFRVRVEPATVAYDRRANAAYFPLALATLTLYIWVGGPIYTDTEFFDVTLDVLDAQGRHLFDVSTRQRRTHWVNLYSDEYSAARCQGPHAEEVIFDLLVDLRDRLRREGTVAGSSMPAGSARRALP